MRIATIDIGTNSVLLLVAQLGHDRTLTPICERARITRLGEGVDLNHRLKPEAIARTLVCLQAYAEEIRALGGVDQVKVVATSASRDAEGADVFTGQAEEILGSRPAVISGDAEARLTFRGALVGLNVTGAVAVQDVGGGSTELVRGEAGGEISHSVSLNVGSVRLTERFIRHDPPRHDETDRIRAHVRESLAQLPPVPTATQWVGIAGTITTLAAVAMGLASYDGARVHGYQMSATEIDGVLARLAGLTLEQRRQVPGLEPARADVIVAGGVIASEVLRWAGAKSMWVSDRGVRWGLAWEWAQGL